MPETEIDNLTKIDKSKYLTFHKNETNEEYFTRICEKGIITKLDWNEFEIIQEPGIGCPGLIMKAKWKVRNIEIVLKKIICFDGTESDNQAFSKEIKAFHAIGELLNEEDNEKIPPIDLYLVLEYANLLNLRYYLSHNDNGILEWKQKIDIARQVVCGLYFLHENGILHRDLNVVIKNDNDKSFEYKIRVIITDFGLSKVLPRLSDSNQEMRDDGKPIEKQQDDEQTTENEQTTEKQHDGEQPTEKQHDGEQPTEKQQDCEQPTEKQQDGEQPTEKQHDCEQPTENQQDGEQPTENQQDGEQPTEKQQDGEKPTEKQQDGEQPIEKQQDDEPPTEKQDKQLTNEKQEDILAKLFNIFTLTSEKLSTEEREVAKQCDP
ncbi:18682_t:CDS:2, partial [Racocetra fulgida]